MVGPQRPQIVLFGSSIVQFSFINVGWGVILADVYARKMLYCMDIVVGIQDGIYMLPTGFVQMLYCLHNTLWSSGVSMFDFTTATMDVGVCLLSEIEESDCGRDIDGEL